MDELERMEREVPKLARQAFRKAALRAGENGFDRIKAIRGSLILVHPDGSTEKLKTIGKPHRVIKGQVIQLNW